MNHITPSKNNDIYFIKSDKFKTFSVSFHFITPLLEEDVSKNALFPFILKQGCRKYPDMKSLNAQLQKYYGGIFDVSARKNGDNHIIDFRFEFLREKFCEEGHVKKVFEFIKDVLTDPLTKDGGFLEEYVEREKKNLIDYINGIINDKREYTAVRIVEEMFKGEPYALFEYGKPEILKKQNGKDLFSQYEKIINKAPLTVFVHGDIDENEFTEYFKDLFEKERDAIVPTKLYDKNLSEVHIEKESQDVVQGKFALGLMTGIKSDEDDYYALTLLNGVFGSGPTSKLFMNVREKMSLCYYVYSRLNRLKGVMYISTGTDRENFEKAYKEIFVQLEDCKKGNITDEEIDFARKFIVSVLKQTEDSQRSVCEFYLTGKLSGRIISPKEYIDILENVTKEDLVRVANKLKLQTEYYLQ